MSNLDTDGCLRLVAEVLSHGARLGRWGRLGPYANYFRSPCGRWWAEMVGLDPAVLWQVAVKGTPAEGKPYAPLSRCPQCRSTDEDLKALCTEAWVRPFQGITYPLAGRGP